MRSPVEHHDDDEVVPHDLVRDLHRPRPLIFWTDLLLCAAVGWGAFAVGIAVPRTPVGPIAIVVAAFALYRGLCFTHELTHLQARAIRGFETAWNLLFGVPLLLPSFTYIGVHQSHHSLATYGTKDDPEYLPFARSRRLIFTFALQSSLLLPVLLVVRFLVLSPAGLAWPRFHRWLEVHASSFSMNPGYRRTVPAQMARKMRRWEAATLAVWAALFAAIASGLLPARTLLLWYGTLVLVSFVNTVRVLGAHQYDSDGRAIDRLGQLLDSIDTPGGPWTELWAPVG